MLEPASLHKEEILKGFMKDMYTERGFYYMGYLYCHQLPNLEPQDGIYRWAIMHKDEVVGYFSYVIDTLTDTVDRFGLMSFKPGCMTVPKDVFDKLEELIATHHKVSWRVVEGNPAQRGYSAFCRKHNGYIAYLHDVTVDPEGRYRGEYIYEIINPEICKRGVYINGFSTKTAD